METNLTESEVIEGYQHFRNFIFSDFNKQLLIDTIKNTINGTEWPMSYYPLRDEYLPGIMGETASQFFFWFALGGTYHFDFELEEEDYSFLNYIYFNYSLKFMRAKQYNNNPFGFTAINFTHGAERDRFNTFIKRNDEEQFMLRTNTVEFSSMLSQSLEYFNNMIQHEAIGVDEDMDHFLENIQEMQESLASIINKISNVGILDDE